MLVEGLIDIVLSIYCETLLKKVYTCVKIVTVERRQNKTPSEAE